MEPEKEVAHSYEQMAIVDKYETVAHGINFLGFRIWPRHKLLRKQSVVRAKRKIAHCLRMADRPGLARFIAAWRGHARHADTCNLFNHLERRHGVRLHQQPR